MRTWPQSTELGCCIASPLVPSELDGSGYEENLKFWVFPLVYGLKLFGLSTTGPRMDNYEKMENKTSSQFADLFYFVVGSPL